MTALQQVDPSATEDRKTHQLKRWEYKSNGRRDF